MHFCEIERSKWYNNCRRRIGRLLYQAYIFNIIHRKILDTGCRDRYSGTSKQNEEYQESSWSSIDKAHCCYIDEENLQVIDVKISSIFMEARMRCILQ